MWNHKSFSLLFATVCLGAVTSYNSTACKQKMNSWCNAQTSCVDIIKKDGFELPLVALYDYGSQGEKEGRKWRCYSPSTLSPNRSVYVGGKGYCSRPALAAVLKRCTTPAVHINATLLFTEEEVNECGYIRTPQPVLTISGQILLFAQCREARAQERVNVGTNHLRDDFRHCRMVLKTSSDFGATWGPMRFVSEEGTGVGVAIFDRVRNTTIFQYQSMPNADPYHNNTLWQKISTDDGRSWSTPVDITPKIHAVCNSNMRDEMMCGAAGSRIQTVRGRLVFSGHNKGEVCVWFSDDGGATYNTSANLFVGNEQSMAQLSDGSLYMNGRGNEAPWYPNRTAWRSFDGGHTWSTPEPTPLQGVNCEAAVIAVPPTKHQHNPNAKQSSGIANTNSTLILSQPGGPGRVSFSLYCSCDNGVTWTSALTVNPDAGAAYSGLLQVPGPKVLAFWEDHPNQHVHSFGLDWCKCAQ